VASPVIEATNTSTEGQTGEHLADLPASIQADDILIVLAALGAPATFGGTLTTEYAQFFTGSSPDPFEGYWKKATGSEGSTIAFTSSNDRRNACHTYRISGARDEEPTVSTVATGTSTSPDPGNIAPGVGSDDFLWLACFVTELGTNTTLTSAPTNYTNFLTAQEGAGSGGCSVGSARRFTTAESEDPGVFTISSDDWAAYGIGVRPLAAAGGIVVLRRRIEGY